MKTLKSGLTLFDFLVYYQINGRKSFLSIKDKGSKAQAIEQLKKIVGSKVDIISVQKQINEPIYK